MPEAFSTTGVPGLDAVLGGTIEPGGLACIVGPPGAGKTVLASQLIFAAARQGVQTLIVTSFAETQAKLLRHLRGFAFFDDALIGGLVTMLALPDFAATDANPTSTLVRMIRECGAKLVLIDGFQSVEPMLGEPLALRRFLAGVSTQLAFVDATLLVTLTGDARDPASRGFLTTPDTLIGLTYRLTGTRHLRTLEVVKQRGRAQLPGRHAYRLDGEGVTVFPRLEVYPPPRVASLSAERAPFGLPELDALLQGGPHRGMTTLLAGAPGAGKTTLALHWALQDARPDSPTLFLTFREYEPQLVAKGASFALDVGGATASGALEIMRVSPVELDVDRLGVQLLAALERQPARLVIDDLAPLLRELGPRAHDYLAALAALLHGAGVSTLVLLEIAPFAGFRLNLVDTPLGAIGENVLMLQQQHVAGVIHRVLAVLRMRLSNHDATLREVVISEQGIRVLGHDATPLGVLVATMEGQSEEEGGVSPRSTSSA